ncbi:MAG: hypothetical protein ACE5SW_11010 [Nitrososphaeraceae archaeon]
MIIGVLFSISVGNSRAAYETETGKLFGPLGHDFDTFFGDRLIGLDENTKDVLKELTDGD